MADQEDQEKPRRQSFRAYPSEPKSERGTFVAYIEESTTNTLLTDAIIDLFAEPNKPKNAMEALCIYFRERAPERANEIIETQSALKEQCLAQELMLTDLRLEAHQLTTQLDELQNEFRGRNKESENHSLKNGRTG